MPSSHLCFASYVLISQSHPSWAAYEPPNIFNGRGNTEHDCCSHICFAELLFPYTNYKPNILTVVIVNYFTMIHFMIGLLFLSPEFSVGTTLFLRMGIILLPSLKGTEFSARDQVSLSETCLTFSLKSVQTITLDQIEAKASTGGSVFLIRTLACAVVPVQTLHMLQLWQSAVRTKLHSATFYSVFYFFPLYSLPV